jgi:hypothetical protein
MFSDFRRAGVGHIRLGRLGTELPILYGPTPEDAGACVFVAKAASWLRASKAKKGPKVRDNNGVFAAKGLPFQR